MRASAVSCVVLLDELGCRIARRRPIAAIRMRVKIMMLVSVCRVLAASSLNDIVER